MNYHRFMPLFVMIIIVGLLAVSSALAIGPTDEAVEKFKADGVWEQKLANLRQFKENGGCSPSEHSPLESYRAGAGLASGAETLDTVINIIVICVDFSDWPSESQRVATTTDDFQTLLFSKKGVDDEFNPTGSMAEYYHENSYGRVEMTGDVFGWYRMPNTYASYIGNNDGLGSGGALLATHAVLAAKADLNVNFSDYDKDGDGHVEVIIVHAGAGAETNTYGIWSHQAMLSIPQDVDGVMVSDYTLNPEEYGSSISTMGVFAHEYGHILGLPDLYDTNPGLNGGSGLGRWSIMAGGSWNGSPSGSTPSHFDAYSKMLLGFLTPVWITENMVQAELPEVEHNPVVYGLGSIPGFANDDFWMVENRQRVGFDAYIPGSGLLIYHVDPSMGGTQSSKFNDHYLIAVEQADGKDELWFGGASNAADAYPGTTNNREFHHYSNPNSVKYDGEKSEVGVWNISNSGSVMYADLDVTFSRPWVFFAEQGDSVKLLDPAPGGNGNGIPEPGEIIEAYFKVQNKMYKGYDPFFTLSVDNSMVEFIQNDVLLKSNVLSHVAQYNENVIPIKFALPEDFISFNANFQLKVTSSRVFGSGDNSYLTDLVFSKNLGTTQLLIVDDDGGAGYEAQVLGIMDRLQVPYDLHTVATGGTPQIDKLNDYLMVVWFNGGNYGVTGDINPAEIAVMREYLDGSGSIYLSSMQGASQMNAIDPVFMTEYFHMNYLNSGVVGLGYIGQEGNPVGQNAFFSITPTANINPADMQIVEPTGGGSAAFQLSPSDLIGGPEFGVGGVTYDGSFRTVFTTFGIEFVGSGSVPNNILSVDTLMMRVMKFFSTKRITGVGDDYRSEVLPNSFSLDQNYPNPFNPTTTISYSVSANKSDRTKLIVYNTLGQKVKTLVDKVESVGHYTVIWDGRDETGTTVASGVYLYRLEIGKNQESKKMMLLK